MSLDLGAGLLASDTDIIADAARLIQLIQGDRIAAKRYLLTWLLALATLEGTIPSDVLDRLVKSAPSAADQRGLVVRLGKKITE